MIGYSLWFFFFLYFFFFNDTATTEIYTLSLHDALPIWNQTMDLSCFYGFQNGKIPKYQYSALRRKKIYGLEVTELKICKLQGEVQEKSSHGTFVFLRAKIMKKSLNFRIPGCREKHLGIAFDWAENMQIPGWGITEVKQWTFCAFRGSTMKKSQNLRIPGCGEKNLGIACYWVE